MYFPKLVSLIGFVFSCFYMMIFHCWSFMEFLFRQTVAILIKDKKSKGDIQSFPDDILINILSRLPADTVLQCRRVCKRMRNLTSTSHFIELQYQTAAKPSIIIHNSSSVRQQGESYFLGTDEATRKLTVTPVCRDLMYLIDNNQIEYPLVLSSCHGLILWRAIKPSISCFFFFICNPLTHEMITLPIMGKAVFVCGFFYHPLAKEHRVFCSIKEGARDCFKIYGLDTNSWRDLSCSYDVQAGSFGTIIANGGLHLLTLGTGDLVGDFILRYDINLEVFDTIRRPKCEDCPKKILRVQLVEVEGRLCYCCSSRWSSDVVIKMWILADPAKNHWVKRYEINLSYQLRRDPFMKDNVSYSTRKRGIELIFQKNTMGFFSYNLQRDTIRKIEIDGKLRKTEHYWSGFAYQKSLVSLKHCLQVSKGEQMKGKRWRGMDGYKNYLLFLDQDFIGWGE